MEYLWTVDGPEPTALPHAKPDYNHYASSQVFPVARSIAAAAGWDDGVFVQPRDRFSAGFDEGQMELKFR